MEKLIQKIKSIPKTYFYLSDIKKISKLNNASLKVAINRLIKNKELIRITKKVYTTNINDVDWKNLSIDIYSPSYISFEYALSFYNILSQKPLHLTLATTKRSKTIETEANNLMYKHIQKKMFWGYVQYHKDSNYLMANPEKAFIDLAYLSLNGYAKFDPEEMNLKILKKNRIKEYLKKINNKKLTKLISSCILNKYILI
ncbi:hypothetical protein KKA23_00690 [Patescibacteria group bacterium]|nr:hypothetical protein [Patescibacteria group bacterium]MBU3922927.1 hypothetical protein [Patescibacteria group bacterium]